MQIQPFRDCLVQEYLTSSLVLEFREIPEPQTMLSAVVYFDLFARLLSNSWQLVHGEHGMIDLTSSCIYSLRRHAHYPLAVRLWRRGRDAEESESCRTSGYIGRRVPYINSRGEAQCNVLTARCYRAVLLSWEVSKCLPAAVTQAITDLLSYYWRRSTTLVFSTLSRLRDHGLVRQSFCTTFFTWSLGFNSWR